VSKNVPDSNNETELRRVILYNTIIERWLSPSFAESENLKDWLLPANSRRHRLLRNFISWLLTLFLFPFSCHLKRLSFFLPSFSKFVILALIDTIFQLCVNTAA
jgi:hypothetical protein